MREKYFFERVREIVSSYTEEGPFSLHLNSFFRSHPNMGAKDRRTTRDFCFTYFRIGRAIQDYSFLQRLAIASFLCHDAGNELNDFLLANYAPQLAGDINGSVDVKLKRTEDLYPAFKRSDIFPSLDMVSREIDREKFLASHFRQPLTWIRLRKKFENVVRKELEEKQIRIAEDKNNQCLGLFPAQKVDDLKTYRSGYFEIQDYSSQQMSTYYKPIEGTYWLDACAASGGKSLLLAEQAENIRIHATDVRMSSLLNYKERLEKSGFKNFKTALHDLSKTPLKEKFDGIIADVPCTGSGTWSRNPEHLGRKHDEQKIDSFVKLQRRIMLNLMESLPVGKPVIYSTCSAYAVENELNVMFFKENFPLKEEASAYLKGFDNRADTMFISRLVKV